MKENQVEGIEKQETKKAAIQETSELINIRTSEDISEISKGLIQFHSQIKNIEKSNVNPFYRSKYATLDSILEYVRPILAECKLSILQFPITAPNKGVSIKTILMSESGQFIESDSFVVIPPKLESQQYGATITYSRRFCLGSILSLSFDVDDDGNSVTTNNDKPTTPTAAPSGRVGRI